MANNNLSTEGRPDGDLFVCFEKNRVTSLNSKKSFFAVLGGLAIGSVMGWINGKNLALTADMHDQGEHNSLRRWEMTTGRKPPFDYTDGADFFRTSYLHPQVLDYNQIET